MALLTGGVTGVANAATGGTGSAGTTGVNAPSAFCHVTDGSFDTCPDGNQEWSDVTPGEFSARHAFLYSDQADLDPGSGIPGSPVDTLMLMYDECGTTVPLGPNDYFLVSFDSVDGGLGPQPDPEHLERYNIHIFSDGTIIFLLNGQAQTDASGQSRVTGIDGQRGHAGFGPSPRCPADHLTVEYQIRLDAAGGDGYSPDPLFWGGTPPNEPPVAVDDQADIADQDSADVPVLDNDSDPDGSLDPTTVTIGSQPRHGTVQIGPSGVVTYQKGDNFEDTDSFTYTVNDNDGATSNTARVTVVGTCAPDQTVPVALPPVTGTKPIPSEIKGYQISYAPLDLTFTTGAPRSPAYCSLDSNAGSLQVQFTCLRDIASPCPLGFPVGVPIPVATSTAVASLDFFQADKVTPPPACDFDQVSNNCLLNPAAGSSIFVRWHTSGFDIRGFGLVPLPGSGPLTFWAGLDGLASPDAPLAAKVNAAEVFFHTTLINFLSSVDRWAIVQDPPAEIRVTAPDGRQTGRTDAGDVVNDIPGSVYSTAAGGRSTALIPEPAAGSYQVSVLGDPGEPFSLSMAVVDLFGDVQNPGVTEQRESGTVAPGGTTFNFDVPAEHRPPLPRFAVRPGFDTTALPANDDGSTGPVPLGFTADFFGNSFGSVFVNNNGNLTFGQSLSAFTPFDLSTTARSIIAPFFADVDTRAGPVARYGTGTVDGHPAFGATWPGVGCFSTITSVHNDFQVVLVDRSDLGPGDFDIEFDYNQVQWEAGTASGGDSRCQGGSAAHVGFAKGTGEPGTFFELPGSGVPGSFLDSNPDTGLVHHSRDSNVPGRYVFAVRNGAPQTADRDQDGVRDDLDNCPATANADQHDANLNGIGDACEPASRQHATAAFVQARLDGQTGVEPTGVGVTEEPGLADRLARIVRFRISAGLADSITELTGNLVDSVVDLGLVAPADAAALQQAVLALLDQAPDCTGVMVDRSTLWPPNHKFATVTVSGATDPDPGDTVSLVVDGVSQDEPVTGGGSGQTAPDAELSGSGPSTVPASASVSVRAERDGTGDGRVYRVHVTGTDRAGLTCQAVVTVAVPHDRAHPAIDSAPPGHDSLTIGD
ncbi:MAG TPA: nidogen-like domain-containing protein [Mycobacteriales bacterium]|nr:nidogen-like domain-containing protein [Mycobacteriales bacterium]